MVLPHHAVGLVSAQRNGHCRAGLACRGSYSNDAQKAERPFGAGIGDIGGSARSGGVVGL